MTTVAARVVVSHGASCIAETAGGTLWQCSLRRSGPRPVCGDRVRLAESGDAAVVEAISERANLLERGDFRGRPRPLAANIDRLVIVAATSPGLDTGLIDRYLTLAAHLGVPTSLWINKADTLDSADRARCERALAAYPPLGYTPAFVSARATDGLAEVLPILRTGTNLLAGPSGVGKSSLIARLVPDQALRVGAVSAASGHGRHTTTATTLFHVAGGGCLIDSPGVRTLRLDHLPATSIRQAFPEITRHLGHCRFRDCRHRVEPGCAVTAAREAGTIDPGRFESFRQLMSAAGAPDI